MPDAASRGLLDTSVVIALGAIDPEQLPHRMSVSALTMAELAAGHGLALEGRIAMPANNLSLFFRTPRP